MGDERMMTEMTTPGMTEGVTIMQGGQAVQKVRPGPMGPHELAEHKRVMTNEGRRKPTPHSGRRKGKSLTVWGLVEEPIGTRVRKMRMRRQMSQNELAAYSGGTLNALANLERNETVDPRCSTVILLARALNVTSDYLLGINPPAPLIEGSRLPEAHELDQRPTEEWEDMIPLGPGETRPEHHAGEQPHLDRVPHRARRTRA
jgi:transcriptional regulator with XRE-family HTH domain